MRRFVLFLILTLLVGVVTGGLVITSASPNGVEVVTDSSWLVVEPNTSYEAASYEDGKLCFDFGKGAGGELYGFQPGSYYQFDRLFKVTSECETDPIRVTIDVTGDMADYKDRILIGVDGECVPGEPDTFIWPNPEAECEIPVGGEIWVSVHFDMLDYQGYEEDLTIDGTLVISATGCGGGGNGGNGGGGPSVENLPEGVFVARWPGHMVLSNPVKQAAGQSEFTVQVTADAEVLEEAQAKGLVPRVYVWNEQFSKWVALASYPQADGTVKAINDGNYSGWTAVFAVWQPRFLDLESTDWYEPVLNRANGLALLEGFPYDLQNPSGLDRLARPKMNMTRAEYVAMVARALGLVGEDEQKMYDVLQPVPAGEVGAVLENRFADASQIPTWSRWAIASALNSGLLDGVGGMETAFEASEPITRIQAGVIVSNALARVPDYQYQASDLSGFTDADQIPSWAAGNVAKGVLGGNPDGSLGPNQPLTRAEAFTVLMRLLRGLGW